MAQYKYERTETHTEAESSRYSTVIGRAANASVNSYRGEASGTYRRQVQAPMGGNRYGHLTVVEGTSARVLAEPERRERPYEDKKAAEAKRTKEHRMPMNLPTVVFLAAAVICTASISIMYLQIQNNVTVRTKNIAALEKEYEALVAENDTLELSIQTYTDFAYVYQIATEELGMRVPTQEQIITFQQSQSEYVIQYDEIPAAEN